MQMANPQETPYSMRLTNSAGDYAGIQNLTATLLGKYNDQQQQIPKILTNQHVCVGKTKFQYYDFTDSYYYQTKLVNCLSFVLINFYLIISIMIFNFLTLFCRDLV